MLGYGYGWHHGFYAPFGWVWGVLFLLLVVLLAVLLVRLLAPKKEDRALEILRERYARGELDEETFRKMRQELRG